MVLPLFEDNSKIGVAFLDSSFGIKRSILQNSMKNLLNAIFSKLKPAI